MATLHSILVQLKHLFRWLAMQPEYKSRIQCLDAECFNMSDRDTRGATARRQQKVPILEQIKHVINTIPGSTGIETQPFPSGPHYPARRLTPGYCLNEIEACRPDCRLRQSGCPEGKDEVQPIR